MPNPTTFWDDLEDFLDEMECNERRELEDIQRNKRDINSHGAGVSVGVIEAVTRIREWLNDPEKKLT